MRYNPLAYIRSEKDILKLVNALILNTKGEGEKSSEDFWVKAERLYYSALIGYIWYEAEPEERNFITLLDLINASEAREDDEEFQSPVDLLFAKLEKEHPDHFAVKQYRKFKMAAGKTLKSILISCGARLAPFDIAELRDLMAEDELELEIYQFTKVLKTVGCDLKFLSMGFPLSLERQKAVLLHHVRQAGDETRIRWLERQIRELEVAETNISSQHFYLAYWGKDADTLRKNHDMIRKYAATGYQPLVEEIDARQKAKVLEKLANMNTIIDIYPDGDDDSAPGFMEEEG